jgi:hypothetical protein
MALKPGTVTKKEDQGSGNAMDIARKLTDALGGADLFKGTKKPLQESGSLLPADVKVVKPGKKGGK